MDTLEISPEDVADKGLALESIGEFDAAADQFSRASELYVRARLLGDAHEMTQRSHTCRRAARRRHR